MRRIFSCLRYFSLCLVVWALACNGQVVSASATPVRNLRLPAVFEPAPSADTYFAHGSGYSVRLQPGSVALSLSAGRKNQGVEIRFAGANLKGGSAPEERQRSVTNYLLGQPSQWRTGVPNYGRIRYRDVYPGTDLVFYGNQRRLEHDFVLRPGADPGRLRLHISTAVHLDPDGTAVLHLDGGDLQLQAPLAYQDVNGERRSILARYILLGDAELGIRVGDYDRRNTLVIDPVISYSTFFGGTNSDGGAGIGLDASGNLYLAGFTNSTDLPTANPLQAATGGDTDVFVAKFDPTGTSLLYSTYVGGSGEDTPSGMAVSSTGEVLVAGRTRSADFPVPAGYTPIHSFASNGSYNAFLFKLAADGSKLAFSTSLSANTQALAVALNPATGTAYVAGNVDPFLSASAQPVASNGAYITTYPSQNGDSFAPPTCPPPTAQFKPPPPPPPLI